jgi:hypothetical protein
MFFEEKRYRLIQVYMHLGSQMLNRYPFNYIGDAPDRYIIEASLVSKA